MRITLVAGALVLLVVGGTHGRYRADLAAALDSVLAGSRIASTAYGPIEYAVTTSTKHSCLRHAMGSASKSGAFTLMVGFVPHPTLRGWGRRHALPALAQTDLRLHCMGKLESAYPTEIPQ